MNDATPSTEWAVACLSHRKFVLTMELLNTKTDRAHKLVYSASGKDTVSEPDYWTQGQFYQRFGTKTPVTFEDFNNRLTLLAPLSYPGAINHEMRIGFLARIIIPQSFSEKWGEWKLFGTTKLVYGNGARSKMLSFEHYDPFKVSDTVSIGGSLYQK
jgi:hypothetical protein